MLIEKIKVQLPTGIQGLTAGKLVHIAEKYTSDVYIEKGYKKIDAKSILGIISLGVVCGEEITLVLDGIDQHALLEELRDFFTGKEVQTQKSLAVR